MSLFAASGFHWAVTHWCFIAAVHLTFQLNFFKILQRSLHCLVELGFGSIIVQYFQKYCFFSLLSSFIGLSFPTVYSICWFHFFVDFCDNWLCQEIKSFRSTQFLSIFFIKTFLNLNRKGMCMHWKKSFGYQTRMFSIVSALLR